MDLVEAPRIILRASSGSDMLREKPIIKEEVDDTFIPIGCVNPALACKLEIDDSFVPPYMERCVPLKVERDIKVQGEADPLLAVQPPSSASHGSVSPSSARWHGKVPTVHINVDGKPTILPFLPRKAVPDAGDTEWVDGGLSTLDSTSVRIARDIDPSPSPTTSSGIPAIVPLPTRPHSHPQLAPTGSPVSYPGSTPIGGVTSSDRPSSSADATEFSEAAQYMLSLAGPAGAPGVAKPAGMQKRIKLAPDERKERKAERDRTYKLRKQAERQERIQLGIEPARKSRNAGLTEAEKEAKKEERRLAKNAARRALHRKEREAYHRKLEAERQKTSRLNIHECQTSGMPEPGPSRTGSKIGSSLPPESPTPPTRPGQDSPAPYSADGWRDVAVHLATEGSAADQARLMGCVRGKLWRQRNNEKKKRQQQSLSGPTSVPLGPDTQSSSSQRMTTPYPFTIDPLLSFPTHRAAMIYLDDLARTFGFATVSGKGDPARGRLLLCCYRSGAPLPPKPNPKRQGRPSARIGCPFEVKAKVRRVGDDGEELWFLEAKSVEHNHGMVDAIDLPPRRRTLEQKTAAMEKHLIHREAWEDQKALSRALGRRRWRRTEEHDGELYGSETSEAEDKELDEIDLGLRPDE